MGAVLELIRIFLYLFVGAGILGSLINHGYLALGIDPIDNKFSSLIWLAMVILLFVFYRNKLQFSGWYKGNNRKLSKRTTIIFIVVSVGLLIITLLI